jgi:hypothetical protein
MPSLEERRLLERRKLQGLFTVYREALGNGHSFLGSDGQEHAIKLVDRSNRRAFARPETAASNLSPTPAGKCSVIANVKSDPTTDASRCLTSSPISRRVSD